MPHNFWTDNFILNSKIEFGDLSQTKEILEEERREAQFLPSKGAPVEGSLWPFCNIKSSSRRLHFCPLPLPGQTRSSPGPTARSDATGTCAAHSRPRASPANDSRPQRVGPEIRRLRFGRRAAAAAAVAAESHSRLGAHHDAACLSGGLISSFISTWKGLN